MLALKSKCQIIPLLFIFTIIIIIKFLVIENKVCTWSLAKSCGSFSCALHGDHRGPEWAAVSLGYGRE